MTYVATFFSHHEALQFSRRIKKQGIANKLMPVPRRVSSSCGTGVQFEGDEGMDFTSFIDEGTDRIFFFNGEDYALVYVNALEAE